MRSLGSENEQCHDPEFLQGVLFQLRSSPERCKKINRLENVSVSAD